MITHDDALDLHALKKEIHGMIRGNIFRLTEKYRAKQKRREENEQTALCTRVRSKVHTRSSPVRSERPVQEDG